MAKRKGILVAGPTGVVGSALVQELLKDERFIDNRIYAIAHSNISFNSLVKMASENQRLRVCRGDITNPDLIENSVVRKEVLDDLIIGFNCAGDVSFSKSFDAIKGVNVEGPLNFARFCSRVGEDVLINLVSTCYVNYPNEHNDLTLVPETAPRKRDFFENAYVESKYKSEILIEEEISKGSIKGIVSILRPGIIMDGSDDSTFGVYLHGINLGLRHHFGSRTAYMDAVDNGKPELLVRLVGDNITLKSISSPEKVARQIATLSLRPNPTNAIFHLTDPPITGEYIGETLNKAFPCAKFKYIGSELPEDATQTEIVINNGVIRYKDHLIHDDRYSTANTDRVLTEMGYNIPNMTPEEFRERVIRCVQENFFKRSR